MAIRRLNIPRGLEATAWLEQATAAAPHFIPAWPDSRRKALVVLVRSHVDFSRDADVAASVVTTRREMEEVTSGARTQQLWFVVPRGLLMNPHVCPALRDDDFEE